MRKLQPARLAEIRRRLLIVADPKERMDLLLELAAILEAKKLDLSS
ncbi:MAG: hypothetical protein AAFP08_07025 [Bacteroidota bacterium]